MNETRNNLLVFLALLLLPTFETVEILTAPISIPESWLRVETPEVDTGNRARNLYISPMFDKFEPTTFPIVLSITVLERWLVEMPELDAGNRRAVFLC